MHKRIIQLDAAIYNRLARYRIDLVAQKNASVSFSQTVGKLLNLIKEKGENV